MSVLELAERRHAARSFDSRELPDATIDDLYQRIRLAPTAFNLQPWRIVEVAERSMLERLAGAAWNQPQISTCSRLLVFCADLDVEARVELLERRMREAGVPEASVAGFLGMIRDWLPSLGDQADHADPRRRQWVTNQVYIALGFGLLAAPELGLDACPMEGFDSEAFAEILGLPESLVPAVLLPVGVSVVAARSKLRFELDQLRLRACLSRRASAS